MPHGEQWLVEYHDILASIGYILRVPVDLKLSSDLSRILILRLVDRHYVVKKEYIFFSKIAGRM